MDVVSAVGTGTLYAGLTLAMWGAIAATIVGALMLGYGVFLYVTSGDKTTSIAMMTTGAFLVVLAWGVKYFLGL